MVSRLLAGLRSDVADYCRLEKLLSAQFDAAMRHQAEEMGAVVAQILALTAILETRRSERVALAAAILSCSASKVSISAVSARLQAAPRAVFDQYCGTLEALVRECKRLNLRNCQLITSQQDIMRRVLNAPQDTYAPA
jgi:flagella synthesis protein FlgN